MNEIILQVKKDKHLIEALFITFLLVIITIPLALEGLIRIISAQESNPYLIQILLVLALISILLCCIFYSAARKQKRKLVYPYVLTVSSFETSQFIEFLSGYLELISINNECFCNLSPFHRKRILTTILLMKEFDANQYKKMRKKIFPKVRNIYEMPTIASASVFSKNIDLRLLIINHFTLGIESRTVLYAKQNARRVEPIFEILIDANSGRLYIPHLVDTLDGVMYFNRYYCCLQFLQSILSAFEAYRNERNG